MYRKAMFLKHSGKSENGINTLFLLEFQKAMFIDAFLMLKLEKRLLEQAWSILEPDLLDR